MHAVPDWLQVLAAVGSAAGLATLVDVYLRHSTPRDKVEQYVGEDPEYRDELAAELRGGRLGGLYRHTLGTALDWLDRHFGPPDSQNALGLCIIIALSYAFAAFVLAWGVGGPGDVAGVELLDEEAPAAVRPLLALSFIAALPLAFALGRWIGRQERQLKLGLRRRWRKRPSELAWRMLVFALATSILFGMSMATGEPKVAAELIFLLGFGTVGPAAGALIGWRLASKRSIHGPTALAVAAAVPVAGASAEALSLAVPLAGALAVASTVALAGAIAGGGAIALAMAGAAAVAGTGAMAGAGALALALAVATAIVVVTGALDVQRWRRGVFPGGAGALAGVGLFALWAAGKGGHDKAVVALVVLFLVLPVVNGLWDWLSWWISRWLGRDLLQKLDPEASSRRRTWTVVWHALADLLAAVLLLCAMAYLLALGFAGYNRVAIAMDAEGLAPLDLEGFIGRAAAAPWTEGLWLTIMLITTLVPTFLHFVMLAASPIALVALPTDRRLALADDLDSYAAQSERQATIRRRAADYVARDRHRAFALATFILVLVLAVFGGFIALIHRGGLAAYVLEVALWGVHAARGLAGLF